MKRMVLLLSILTTIVIIIPSLLVTVFSFKQTASHDGQRNPEQVIDTISSSLVVPVYRTKQKDVENIPIETYVAGVLSSEMPAEFEMEALKAQAMAARTYIVKQLLNPSEINLPEEAVVTDTELHQVYKSSDELKALWGDDYDWKYARIAKAVAETSGEIVTYNDEPITAAFFSTSNGFTENAEDYWENELPYLQSVASPWDKDSPKFATKQEIPVSVFENELDISLANNDTVGKIVKRTQSDRVAQVEIAGETLTGREVREKLDLNSTDFSWERDGNTIVVHTKGYGHGVGMSQYGANGMALEGKNAKEIISYYYNDVEVANMSPFVANLTAKQ